MLTSCSTVVDPDDPPVAEVSQALAQCGPNFTCGSGWTCADRLDGACHPQCRIFDEAITATTIPGGCAGFPSWRCCIGYVRPDGSEARPYCAARCPTL